MSNERPNWPANPRPYVAYRPPPTYQPTRSESPRAAWAEVRRFLTDAAAPYAPKRREHVTLTTRRWSADSAGEELRSWLDEWPAECSVAELDAAMRLAEERFGRPKHRGGRSQLKRSGLESELVWHIPIDRIDEVVDLLERVPSCTGGKWAPVHASYFCQFRLRNLETGAVLPQQGARFQPMQSSLTLVLQRRSTAWLTIIFPFANPDAATADHVVALQTYAPVWLDPRYFDHMTPEPDGPGYHRVRLTPDWIGLAPDGTPRLDVSRSGIGAPEVELPTEEEMAAEDRARDDAPFQANCTAIANALRRPSLATLLIRGADDARYMVEHAARWLERPLHVVTTLRSSDLPSIEEELRTVVSGLNDRPTLLLLEIVQHGNAQTNAALLSQMAGRVLLGVELPPAVRLVVSIDAEPGKGVLAAQRRWMLANTEGFGTRRQIEFLERQANRAGWREVVIEELPVPPASS